MAACAHRYELAHVVRTHMGADDEAFRCVYQQDDDDGITGMRLDKARPRACACVAAFALARTFGCRMQHTGPSA